MQRLVLTVNNWDNTQLLLNWMQQFNFIQTIEITKPVAKTSKISNKELEINPVFWLDEIANNGGIKSIPNPVEWQKEVRTDNVLFNRE